MTLMGIVLFFLPFLCILSSIFRSTVGRQDDGPLWAVMAALEAHLDDLGHSCLQAAVWSRFRGYVDGLRPVVLGCLGAPVDNLGPLSGPLATVLGRFGAYADGLGSPSGPLWAVLSRSRGLCGRSWAVLNQL